MEDFTIDSLTCKDTSTYVTEYNSDNNDKDDLCWFGQTMDVVGSVTIAEPIYRYFNAKLYLCFQKQIEGLYSFRSYNKCFTYTKKIDLMALSQAQQASNSYQGGSNQQDDQDQTYSKYRDYNYLQTGSYQFQTHFTIPKKSFTFHEGKFCVCDTGFSFLRFTQRLFFCPYLSGYLVKAELTLFPQKPYSDLYKYKYDSYGYKTVCHATFAAGDDEYVASVDERYQYYAAGGIITCMAAVAALIGAKRRRLFTCEEADPASEDGEGQTAMNFQKMEREKPDP